MAMNKDTRRALSSKKLAEMASFQMNEHGYGITYVPNGEYVKDGAHLWHGMNATKTDGSTWKYWLRFDFDSYAGAFMDSLEKVKHESDPNTSDG